MEWRLEVVAAQRHQRLLLSSKSRKVQQQMTFSKRGPNATSKLKQATYAFIASQLLSKQEKEDIDTVGGLVFNLLGKIPSRGEVINHKSGLEFTIRDADTRKIKRILVNVK